jgi:two-component system sensor histidine kinase YesM
VSKIISKFSPSLGRIVALAVLLTLVAQVVLLVIGFSYANSIDRNISDKRAENVLSQYEQSSLYLMSDINNLLQLLQTSEFNDYFKSHMVLRDKETDSAERLLLLRKIDALNLSPRIVNSIYFIGNDWNQVSLRKVIGSPRTENLEHLHMDLLEYSQLDKLFLKDHDQFTLYTDKELNANLTYRSKLLSLQGIGGIQDFVSNIKNHLIITNGNVNGVLIVIVLDDHFFEYGMPPERTEQTERTDPSVFSVILPSHRLIWSSTKDTGIRQAIMDGQSRFDHNGITYTNRIKNLSPFQSQVVYSSKEGKRYFSESVLFVKMILLSAITLFVTLMISLFYMKQVFKPFRTISRLLKNQSIAGEKALHSIPENLTNSRFHAASMRNKLILVLCAAVMIPTISYGFMYSRFSTQAVQSQMNASLKEIGDFSGMNIKNHVKYLENLINQLSVSQKFQAYLTDRTISNTQYPNADTITISMFPGLNEVSYFVLLDEEGNTIYSSIFSNNKDIFKTETRYLKQNDVPYWISEYQDVFNHTTTAVVKRTQLVQGDNGGATYLLLVPKDSVFENIGYGLVNAYFSISDENAHTIYQSRLFPDENQQGFLRFMEQIPDSKWTISIAYADYEVLNMNREYQFQFLLIILIVFMLSVAAAMVLSGIMVRPIKELVLTMESVGNGNFQQQVDYEGRNEIGGIIRSFNKMVRQLEEEIQQNLRITEENANNKIRENDLIAMKTRAELQMLQAQINPHFLYNTLEAINMRSMKNGNKEISVMVGALADLFRYSISRGTDDVELGQELKHVTNYVLIQQIRFGHSFDLEFNVPEPLKRARVLRFILQPIVENAIKHGFEGWQEGGLICISASETSGRLQLEIRDNGVGMNKDSLEQLNMDMKQELGQWKGKEGRIGLGNVYHRLRLFFQDDISMDVSSSLMKGTVVRMEFPLLSENT